MSAHETPEPNPVLEDPERLLEALGWHTLERVVVPDDALAARVALDAYTTGTILVYEEEGRLVPHEVYTERRGVRHGFTMHLGDGHLSSFTPTRDGHAHGICIDYYDGVPTSRYVMNRGTGTTVYAYPDLTSVESYEYVNGKQHGFSRIWHDTGHVCVERHYDQDRLHGVFRAWDHSPWRLRDGYPVFVINGEEVTRSIYTYVSAIDPTLPFYRFEDDAPEREPLERLPLDDVPTLEDILTRLVLESLADEDAP